MDIYIFAAEIFIGVFVLASISIIVDPFFHYHKPLPGLFYVLNNERYQNDGILKNFDYDSIITGTSMSENFKTSEFNELFKANAVKAPFSGGSFKEMNDNIATAFRTDHDIKYVVRSLDTYNFLADKDKMRNDLGQYPVYLYNDNLLDDVKYIFNKDVIKIAAKMIKNTIKNKNGGITSFDEFANWNDDYKFGAKSVLKSRSEYKEPNQQNSLTKADKQVIGENIKQNVTDLAYAHPKTTFYYFFPPYRYAIELILECPNIKLFSFNTMTDITMNLDNYKDTLHYGEWINSKMLEYMKNDIGLLTKNNYKKYIEAEEKLYLNYQYNDLFK